MNFYKEQTYFTMIDRKPVMFNVNFTGERVGTILGHSNGHKITVDVKDIFFTLPSLLVWMRREHGINQYLSCPPYQPKLFSNEYRRQKQEDRTMELDKIRKSGYTGI